MRVPDVLAPLARLSAELGRDVEQIQAAGGNTSLKDGRTLWVKASGFRLADADSRQIFIPVDLDRLHQGLARDPPDAGRAAVLSALNPDGLRPSIETTMHGVLPHTIVLHTHSVRAIALAVRADCQQQLTGRLAGLNWAMVPYRKPGLELTAGILDALKGRGADVLVLGNHGLVVGADTVEAAAALLKDVEGRLDGPVATEAAGDPDLDGAEALGRSLRLRPARHARTHFLAHSPPALRRARAGSLYPDHVIFLGPSVGVIDGEGDLVTARQSGCKAFIVPGRGLFIEPDCPDDADELALCLALVLSRVPDDANLVYLDADDEAALLHWDAEKYRQKLALSRRN